MIPGPLSSGFRLPTLQLAHANTTPNNPWLPAGPALDKLQTPIFGTGLDELPNPGCLICPPPPIDLTDYQLPANLATSLSGSSQFLVTQPIQEHGYYEIEMDLSNTFWNCNFNFGNSTCGINIRQGISHLIDKNAFVANDSSVSSTAVAIDNPVSIDNGGVVTPNPCSWDLLYTGTNGCFTGGPGGNAYRIGKAPAGSTGAQPNPSPDFCAAAGHFIAAGVAVGVVNAPTVAAAPVWWQHQPSDWTITAGTTNCQLTGVTAGTTPNFFIRADDGKRLDLGNILASQICLLLTGSGTPPCANLTITRSLVTAFPGFATLPALPNDWWFYTASFIGTYPYDSSLYNTYNSNFVSGTASIQGTLPGHTCSPRSVGTYNAPNYMYLCDNKYDQLTTAMEFASTPAVALTAASAAEDRFGRGAYTIPIMNSVDQFEYPNNGFVRVVNANLGGIPNTNGVGIANFYSWLDAWNPNPPVAGTIRQGFSEPTRSVSPYITETAHDYYIVGSIYDKLGRANPYSPGQLLNWMTQSTNLLCNSAMQCATALTYSAPLGTVATYRYTLRNDMFFQDGTQVTSLDVAFSYLSLLAAGAFQSAGAAPVLSITLLGPTQFDLNLNANGPVTPFYLSGLTIMPGRYWTSVGASSWDSAISSCSRNNNCYPAQYGINFALTASNGLPSIVCNIGTGLTTCPFSANNMNVDGTKVGGEYDPVASGNLIGSGPWMCVSPTGVRGGGCTPSGAQDPGVNTTGYTLTRFGTGHLPGTTLTDGYFRSDGSTALWFWSGDTGDFTHDFLNLGEIEKCVGAPLGTPGCIQWQQGIGGDMNGQPTIVQPIPQVSIVSRFVSMDPVSEAANLNHLANPTAPWTSIAIPGLAVGPANSFDGFPAPVLYEGTMTLNPASIAGCALGYPTGGYDC